MPDATISEEGPVEDLFGVTNSCINDTAVMLLVPNDSVLILVVRVEEGQLPQVRVHLELSSQDPGDQGIINPEDSYFWV